MDKSSILFDIDGTLLYAKGIGRLAFARSFREAYGVDYPDMDAISFVGATDAGVLRRMAGACGVESTPAREEHFYLLISARIDEALARERPHVYPGVPAFVRALAERFTLGLVTGNARGAAWSKLRHAGIDTAFSFGAYGDEHALREDIARTALTRAPASARPAVLVGDTPSDIAAARACGLKALAVATGWVAADALREAGAACVLEDFSDTARSLDAVSALLDAWMAEAGRLS